MKFYFLSNINMSKKAGLITTVAISAVLAIVAPVNAEKSQVNLSFSKEPQQPVCKTILACEELAISIQSQINEIEKSDEPDFDKLDNLQNQLLAALKTKTARQREETARLKAETKASYDKLNANLESLKGAIQ